ncbi:hypothetical protein CU097_011467 [Rhizopus azygosporus]|uniref:Uncharacterized protein n=1 Tax=Rhizopus azygosporus TaxID=86630 RepID=A0A367KHN2_RHIAZ|nr:hypothetical protein CU097_011467 [Rhizopus azygosporus]
MSIETENDTLWLWALINCHLPSPASIQNLRDEQPELPEDIQLELETSSKIQLKNKLKQYAKETIKFEGGKWTQTGTIKKKEEKLPNSTQEIYDVKVLIQATLSWGLTSELNMSKLQLKTLTLLTMATMWRPRSDMGTLQFRDVKFQMKGGVEDEPLSVTLTARSPKEL